MRVLQNEADDFGEARPAFGFGFELGAAFGGEAVELGFAAGVGRPPLGGEELLVLKPVERGIKRALLDLQRLFRDELHALGDGVAVDRAERDNAQDEQVERALGEVKSGLSGHTYDFYLYRRDV